MIRSLACLAAMALTPLTANAQEMADVPIDAGMRADVVKALGDALEKNYVFPDKGTETGQTLERLLDSGKYDRFETANAFAEALRSDLREAGDDRHLQLRYDPEFVPQGDHTDGPPSAEEVAETYRQMALHGFGVARTAMLPGNIGYIDLRFFGPPEAVAGAYESAIQLVSGSQALIIDLRSNGGGDPAAVAQFASHLFAKGDVRHLNSIYDRTEDRTREFWTDQSVETRYTGLVYVLTSSRTFSGGEELAYDIQTQKRGTLFGETTGGGANPGGPVALAHGFTAFIPTGRAINPVTGTNWEHVGVKPEVSVPAEEALSTAFSAAIEALRTQAEGERSQLLGRIGEQLANGELLLPQWKDPRRRD
ncbi:N-terminal domain of Peptidase_S41 [Qipengyuania nanhaisediminis]|uniref:N-terminal domain of Peptidase_S41 n=2 Tax=Qipengyuania nanhaisediminis TaxID=604088 RepID=A0A1I5PP23_9SPHN|nr:N-terminal domain of Peptidase_S41 [Qipengyuania nanhaisediminis]